MSGRKRLISDAAITAAGYIAFCAAIMLLTDCTSIMPLVRHTLRGESSYPTNLLMVGVNIASAAALMAVAYLCGETRRTGYLLGLGVICALAVAARIFSDCSVINDFLCVVNAPFSIATDFFARWPVLLISSLLISCIAYSNAKSE